MPLTRDEEKKKLWNKIHKNSAIRNIFMLMPFPRALRIEKIIPNDEHMLLHTYDFNVDIKKNKSLLRKNKIKLR